MALTVGTFADVVVELQDRGAVDGSPTALSVTAVTTLAKRLSIRKSVSKRIDVSGFGTAHLFRPGKTMYEVNMDLNVAYSGKLSLTAGNYLQLEYTLGSNSEEKYCVMIESYEETVDDEDVAVMRIAAVGPVDGGSTS